MSSVPLPIAPLPDSTIPRAAQPSATMFRLSLTMVSRFLCIALVVILSAQFGPLDGPSATAAEKPLRFTAMMSNGARLTGRALSVAPPPGSWQLDQQPLFDPTNPVRWLRDRTLVPTNTPSAFVELVTGDRLPGQVLQYRDGSQQTFEPEPPHFLVRPDTSLVPPVVPKDSTVRVVARFVRRIVWQKRESELFQPSTAFFRDGRSIAYRAVRFGETGVQLLTADGQRKADYAELAEVHLAAADPWDWFYDELAGLCPAGVGRLVQLETTDGLIVTASRDRLRLYAPGGPQDATRWSHGAHPVWSLDALWLPQTSVWMMRSWDVNELPLSRLQPASRRQRGWLIPQGPPPRINRNVQAGLMRSGGFEHGWGFGVQAHSTLTFQLPAAATTFHSAVGIDRVAGRGGCVRVRVLADNDTNPRYDSGFLVGSDVISDTGIIALNPTGKGTTLVLDVDAAHEGRPAGSDPFDIRDMVDWADPLVQLEASRLLPEIQQRVPRYVPAWQGWAANIVPAADAALDGPRSKFEWQPVWDELLPYPGHYFMGLVPKTGSVQIERELSIGLADEWLVVAISQASATNPPAKVEVSIDDEPVSEAPLSVRNTSVRDPAPLIVPLEHYRGRTARVRVTVIAPPAAATTPIWWRLTRTSSQLPTLHRVAEDELRGTGAKEKTPAAATEPRWVTEDRFVGSRSIEVPAEKTARLALAAPLAIREQPGWGEFRYIRFAVRKAGQGRFSVEFLGLEPRETPMRLDGGMGDPVGGAAVRIYQANLPDQWLALPHDLFASFGRSDLSEIVLGAPDGQYARYDSIYFARNLGDFDQIAALSPPPPIADAVRDAALRTSAMAAGPALVRVEVGDGKDAAGVVVSPDGDVLLPARVAPPPNQAVKVHLADGRVVAGQTRGAARALDVALVKITDAGPWPAAQILTTPILPVEQPYIQVQPGGPASASPEVRMVQPWRQYRNTFWTSAPAGRERSFATGLALLDAAGRVAGLASRPHGEGVLYVRLHEVPAVLPRLKNGDVW